MIDSFQINQFSFFSLSHQQLSPLLQDTVLKGTFNATLNNPVATRMEMTKGTTHSRQAFMLGV